MRYHMSGHFRVMFFPPNSNLKSCIKSMRVKFSQNYSKNWSLPCLNVCVKFMQLHFSWLWYSREHSGNCVHMEKTWYTVPKAIIPMICVNFWRKKLSLRETEEVGTCSVGHQHSCKTRCKWLTLPTLTNTQGASLLWA